MPLTRHDALRLLHFCLGPDDSGSVDLADDGAALVTVAPAEAPAGMAGVRTFEAATFDAALRQAADAGMLKAACVEKQIVFLSNGAGQARQAGNQRSTSELDPTRPPPRDLFPRLVTAVAALLHELQVERGMSAICAASSGRHFRRDLGRQRERTDGKRTRLTALRRELAEPLGTTLTRRFERVDAQLRAVLKARAALDSRRDQLPGAGGDLLGDQPGAARHRRRRAGRLRPRRAASERARQRGLALRQGEDRDRARSGWEPPLRRGHSPTRIARRWRVCCRRGAATCTSSPPPRRARPRSCLRGRWPRPWRSSWRAPRI